MSLRINLFFLLFLINANSFCQSKRDIYVVDSIQNKIYNLKIDKNEYQLLKKNILNLEKNGTYEPEMKFKLLEKSFSFSDIIFFKNELTILVEKYGFNVSYMTENETYYNAIMNGELSTWFKEMYLEKHFIWLKNNFNKQIDLRKLNEFANRDQLINNFSSKIFQTLKLDSIQKQKEIEVLSDFMFKNISQLYVISEKNNLLPNSKSFALIQNDYGIVETHNLQLKTNIEKYFILFYDYYKKAYLNNEITYTRFLNFDNFFYVHYGYQVFGLINKKNIPEYYWGSNKDPNEKIPIKDNDFLIKVKKEFKW